MAEFEDCKSNDGPEVLKNSTPSEEDALAEVDIERIERVYK
jgi:hypothetical protein